MSFANSLSCVGRVLVFFVMLCLLPTPSQAQGATGKQTPSHNASPRITALLGQLEKVRNLQQVALSPDGRQIAWVVDSPAGGTEIELAPLARPASTRQITATAGRGSCDEDDLAWAPDGKHFAFLSNCNSPDQMQIFLADPASMDSPRQIGKLEGIAHSLEWSRNGESLGFLYVPGATRRAGALDAMKPPSGVIGESGLEIQRVAAVEPAIHQLQFLTPADLHVYEFDWSPDSRQLAYIAAAPPGENNWWVAQLYVQAISLAGGVIEAPRSIFDPNQSTSPLHGLQIAVPRWSPEGKQLAFIGGLMSDQGATGGDLYTLAAAGGEPRLISPDVNPDVSITWISWDFPNHVSFSYIAGGLSGYGVVQPSNNAADAEVNFLVPATIGDGRMAMSLSFAKDGTVAFIRSSYSQAPEVWAGHFGGAEEPPPGRRKRKKNYAEADRAPVLPTTDPPNGPHQITHYNDALKPAWGKAESITWSSDASTGKFAVQGWLLYPASYDPAKKYPMIVSVHGGPAAAQLPVWPGLDFHATAFSALDYFVFFPNPRGSYGQGEAFTMANRKDFGYGDLHDILTGVDAAVARYPIDSKRIGLTGWSYGGFMTMFAITQTDRFRAAVAGAGISNWQSYYGQNSIDQWMVPYFGASFYSDPAAYYRSSAINFIRQAKTPTLVVVGDRDGECPAPQSFEFWHALRALNVPTRLVVYPNEGHHFVSPEHRRDVLERALQWFDQYMPSADAN